MDCWIDNSKKTCYISNFRADCERNRNLTIQYFTSNLFNRLLELKGYLGIHSSCVERNGHGIIFIGNRMTGKTTCMLNLLNNGFNLVNNDTAAIKYFANEHRVEAVGIVKNIFIRMNKNFSSQPQNQRFVRIAKERHVKYDGEVQLEDNRIVLTPLELTQLSHVELIPAVTLSAIVIPQYNENLRNLRLTLQETTRYQDFFNSHILSLVHDTTSFLSDICIHESEICNVEDCITGLSALPCYLCEYNDDTLFILANVIQDILK